ncbi:oxidoreductase [Hymenobacter qilianensis]|uniref:Gfo/Idh/MocA family oxidoreductase n=3 Tax=Hymenobacter qilianensis TaxID=1385715 RepID=A0A7H0GY82_9BACT|nr:Gfo/Idh/MocA family oxidoreductase [Hymenobacter qilianensis]QNP53248.1 Gfo/Idh/MocA family oxidoreductase [Hymenobacter qilianensis]GGF58361.1 oxidoreductase [Hymenobacter qilianensis]
MTTTNPIQTGLLAYGMSGKVFHAPFLAAHPGFVLRAVTERHQKQAQQDYPNLISYDSVEALLADSEIELIVVNTPSNTHFDLARQALEAGKHVLIEKPLVTSSAEVKELEEFGQLMNRHVFAYQNRRWDSDFQSVKQVIDSGQLGQLIEVHFRFDRYKTALNTKAFKETPIPGSGLVYDLGPHLLDQAISLFGKPTFSRKTTGMFRPGSQVPDYFCFHLHYPDGLQVFLTSSLLVAQPQASFVLHGAQGSFSKARTDVQENQLQQGIAPQDAAYGLEAPGQEGILTLASADGQFSTHSYPAPKGDYMQLFEALYQTIRNGIPYLIKLEQIRWQMELLEQSDDTL